MSLPIRVVLFSLFSIFASCVNSQAEGLLGKNYVRVGGGTTVYRLGGFKDRQYSFDGSVAVNYNVTSRFDLGLSVDTSHVSGEVLPHLAMRFEGRRASIRGTYFWEATPRIRPYLGLSAGIVYERWETVIGSVPGGAPRMRNSDDATFFSVAGGFEVILHSKTTLNLGVARTEVGSMPQKGGSGGSFISTSAGLTVTHFFSHRFFGSAGVTRDFGSNRTSLAGAVGVTF